MSFADTRILLATVCYNEADLIVDLIKEIRSNLPAADVLVVDDSSTDGTNELLAEIEANDSSVHLATRPWKAGIGSAHLFAMSYAFRKGYDFLITLDADFSHDPRKLPDFAEKLKNNDFVIGSRYITGGSCEYTRSRKLLSIAANIAVRLMLKIPLHETTTSYRGFSRALLEKLLRRGNYSEGYAFFYEVCYEACRLTPRTLEIPIFFSDRRKGSSKLSKFEIIRGFLHLFRLFLNRLFGNSRDQLSEDDQLSDDPCPFCGNLEKILIFERRAGRGAAKGSYSCSTTSHGSHPRIVRCLNCCLMYADPLPSAEDLNTIYAAIEDTTYVANLAMRRKTFIRNWKTVLPIVPVPPARVLDIGAYYGEFVAYLSELGYAVKGIEPSTVACSYCKNERGLDVLQLGVEQLPIPGERFDIVTAWDVFEHLANPKDSLRKINQSMGQNAVFLFSTLNINNWFPKLLGRKWPWYIDMHLLYPNPKNLALLLNECGFEIMRIDTYCHIISGSYLMRKLTALQIPGIQTLHSCNVVNEFLQKIAIPFRFGDIVLISCKKKIVSANCDNILAASDK